MKKYYSLREISSTLDIPKSTVVKYKDTYIDFMRMVGQGRRKKFTEESMEVLKTIRHLREEEKLDWLEIKDQLESTFGRADKEPETETGPQTSVVRAQAPAVPDRKIEYIQHMMNTMGTEVIRLSTQVAGLCETAGEQSGRMASVMQKIDEANRKLDLVMGGVMNVDAESTRRVSRLAGEVRADMQQVTNELKTLSEKAAHPSDNGQQLEEMKNLSAQVHAAINDEQIFKSKYAILKKENEALQEKIRDMKKEFKRTSGAEQPARSAKSVRVDTPQKKDSFWSRLFGK